MIEIDCSTRLRKRYKMQTLKKAPGDISASEKADFRARLAVSDKVKHELLGLTSRYAPKSDEKLKKSCQKLYDLFQRPPWPVQRCDVGGDC